MDKGKKYNLLQMSAADAAEVPAMVPALLLCAVTLLMLVLDIILPSMKDAQYIVYPALIKTAGLIGLVCAAACLRIDMYSGRMHPDVTSVLFMLFLGCVLISTLINGLTQDVLFGVRYRFIGIFDLAVYFAVYMYCSSHIRTQYHKRLVLVVFTALSDAVAAVFLYDEFFGGIPAFQGRMEPGGMFFHGNHYGYFLVMALIVSVCILLSESGKTMIFGTCSVILNMFALVICRSMGAVLASGVIVLLLMIRTLKRGSTAERKKVLVLVLLFAAGAAATLSISSSFRNDLVRVFDESSEIASGTNNIYAGNGRWGLWQFTLIYISEKPLFGFGCEGITERLYELTKISNPHNELLTYAAYFGIPAAILYSSGALVKVFRALKASDLFSANTTAAFAALGYFVSSMFGVAMFYTTPLFFVMLGLLSASNSIE